MYERIYTRSPHMRDITILLELESYVVAGCVVETLEQENRRPQLRTPRCVGVTV